MNTSTSNLTPNTADASAPSAPPGDAAAVTGASAPSATAIADIKSIHQLATPWRDIGILSAICIGLAVLTFFIVKRIKANRASQVNTKTLTTNTLPELPWYEIAQNNLQAMQPNDLPSRDHVQAFYFELSAVLRFILEKAFQFNATDLTYKEILNHLTTAQVTNSCALKSEQMSYLRDYFRRTEYILFAKQEAASNKAEIDHRWVQDLLRSMQQHQISRNLP